MRKECCLAIDNHEALIGVGEWMSRMRVDLMERTGGMSDFFYFFYEQCHVSSPTCALHDCRFRATAV